MLPPHAKARDGLAAPCVPVDNDLLAELDRVSVRTFGYVDDYAPYRIAYPWLLARLAALPADAHVLDLGAGVSALPITLAERGLRVDCVDSSPVDRVLPATPEWNGWGFLDYATVNPRMRSFRERAQKFTGDGPYAAVMSAGMFAHLPASDRRACFTRCRDWLLPEGQLLAYVDLHAGSDWIWNRCGGDEVESLDDHGRSQDLLAEIECAGLALVETQVHRRIPGTRTDVMLVRAVRPVA